MGELRPHADEQVLALLKLLLPLHHSLGDHVLDGCLILAVQYVAHPLLVEVVPVLLIRQMLEQSWLLPGVCQEVFDRQAINLWHC